MLAKFKAVKPLQFKDFRQELTLAIALFSVALLAGILQFNNPPEAISMVLQELTGVANSIKNDDGLNIFSFILTNNIAAAFSVIIGGILFAISPLLSAIVHGYLLGVITGTMVHSGNGLLILPGILPHGVFELPALFFAIALGIRLGRVLWYTLKIIPKKTSGFAAWYPKFQKSLLPLEVEIIASLKYAWHVITPLIVLAALIEATATPALLDYFSSR